jgi:hypothetical protein
MLSTHRLDGHRDRVREAMGAPAHFAFLRCIPTVGAAYVDPLASPRDLPTAAPRPISSR